MARELIKEELCRSVRAIGNVLEWYNEKYGINLCKEDAEDFEEEFEYQRDRLYLTVYKEEDSDEIKFSASGVPWSEWN